MDVETNEGPLHVAGSTPEEKSNVIQQRMDVDQEICYPENLQLCILGEELQNHAAVREAASTFGIPVIYSKEPEECLNMSDKDTIFVLHDFDSPAYQTLYKREQRIIGHPALLECEIRRYPLPELMRPLYCIAMTKVVVCFSGFRNKEELRILCTYVQRMGGSVRKDLTSRITHLIANCSGSEKYTLAVTLGTPVMTAEWVYAVWGQRLRLGCQAVDEEFVTYRAKIFHNLRIHLFGFSVRDQQDMADLLLNNGGKSVSLDDPGLSHVVLENGSIVPEGIPSHVKQVRAEWFWASVQMDSCADANTYAFNQPPEVKSPAWHALSPSTPGSQNRKRKRLIRDTVSHLAAGSSPSLASPAKRRSSVSDAAMLSLSQSFLEVTDNSLDQDVEIKEKTGLFAMEMKDMSSREKVFMELLQTETNYVGVLHTINNVFRMPLEMENQPGGPLLDGTEVRIIFGNLPPIIDVHQMLLRDLKNTASSWNESANVGQVFIKYHSDLLRAYPPYVNFFESSKEMLVQCDRQKPRFHAFLKIGQGKPECGRQSLQELMIRPVQRLPSVSLLLNDLLKHTSKGSQDHVALEEALAMVKDVNAHVNEDKRKTESQLALFDIFNDIENCPPHMVNANRSFVNKIEVLALNDAFNCKGEILLLCLFSDVLEVCKRRSSKFNSLKSPSTANLHQAAKTPGKQYKHLELIQLQHIKRVVDVKETEECRGAFALIKLSPTDVREQCYSCSIISEDVEKSKFLRSMAETICVLTSNNTENLLTTCEPGHLAIDTSEVTLGTLGRAARLASKINRAFSFNKTPSKLKRAVSSMMSPRPSKLNLGSSMLNESVVSLREVEPSMASCSNLTVLESQSTMSLNMAMVKKSKNFTLPSSLRKS